MKKFQWLLIACSWYPNMATEYNFKFILVSLINTSDLEVS